MTSAQKLVLAALALAGIFGEYGITMLLSALPLIAADFGASDEEVAYGLGMVRLGAVPALALVAFADRIGRRPVFLAATVGAALATVASAFAPTLGVFVAIQAVHRACYATGLTLGIVILTEQVPEDRRGGSVALLVSLSALGHGLGALLFSQVESLPDGWRTLYHMGGLALLALPFWWRAVPESAPQAASPDERGPIRQLLQRDRTRSLAVLAVSALIAAGYTGAYQFSAYVTIGDYGWSPGQFAWLIVLGGGLALGANAFAGRMSDRLGRRTTSVPLLALFPAAVAAFYLGPTHLAGVAWVIFVACFQASRSILRTLVAESFGSSTRASASGLFAASEVGGQAAGFFLIAPIAAAGAGLGFAVSVLAGTCMAGAVVLLLLPVWERSRGVDFPLPAAAPSPAPARPGAR